MSTVICTHVNYGSEHGLCTSSGYGAVVYMPSGCVRSAPGLCIPSCSPMTSPFTCDGCIMSPHTSPPIVPPPPQTYTSKYGPPPPQTYISTYCPYSRPTPPPPPPQHERLQFQVTFGSTQLQDAHFALTRLLLLPLHTLLLLMLPRNVLFLPY